jgi:asparagine synthase (glutamine-hydrolysing)
MCGFAGVVDFSVRGDRSADAQEGAAALLERMGETIAHRGPDERGRLIEGACGLAHRRLSIVDLSGSHQPMSLPGCDVSLAYNGELYNYQALRQSLAARGEKFQTAGDTEVLLRWVAAKWADGLRDLDGMFAFAAWDRSRQRLLLVRDPIGEKPLFYAAPRADLLVFGSEVKAVLAHPEVQGQIDEDSLRQALRFRTVYGERSLYRGVRQVPPGFYLEFDRDGSRLKPYFDLVNEARGAQGPLQGMSEGALIEHGRELLETAISERLMADVPLGVFLSGGLDSSLIAAITKRISPEHSVRTFSVGFESDEHSETGFAREVAEAIGAVHTEVRVGPEEFQRRLGALSGFRDGPVSEPADVAVAALSRAARQHVKVVLSGEGADEAFAGYPKYTLARVPRLAGRAIALAGPARVAKLASWAGMDRRRALVAARAIAPWGECDRLTQWFSYFDQQDLAALLPGLGWSSGAWCETAGEQKAALKSADGLSRIARMQAVDCLTWLPGNMLERGDRMTMSQGLELRPPFLDRQLVAFGLALPDRMKVRGKWTKWIVRQWGSTELPPAIHRRPKWGFRVPLARWFRAELREMLFDYLGTAGGLCGMYGNRRAIFDLLNRHDSGQVDANLALWGLLSAEIWYQGARGLNRDQVSPARAIAAESAMTAA